MLLTRRFASAHPPRTRANESKMPPGISPPRAAGTWECASANSPYLGASGEVHRVVCHSKPQVSDSVCPRSHAQCQGSAWEEEHQRRREAAAALLGQILLGTLQARIALRIEFFLGIQAGPLREWQGRLEQRAASAKVAPYCVPSANSAGPRRTAPGGAHRWTAVVRTCCRCANPRESDDSGTGSSHFHAPWPPTAGFHAAEDQRFFQLARRNDH